MFKKNFIKLCNRKGVSPSAVMNQIGLSAATYSCWTDESVPRKTTLHKLADYFDITVDELLAEEPPQIEKPADNVDELLATIRNNPRKLMLAKRLFDLPDAEFDRIERVFVAMLDPLPAENDQSSRD